LSRFREAFEIEVRAADSTRCPLCGADDPSRRFRKHGFDYHQCRDCGHLFVSPLPSALETNEHARKSYTADYLDRSRAWFEELAERRTRVLRPLLKDRPEARILDIGCGYGLFLARARLEGWRVVGIEAAAEPSRYAREELGLPILEGDAVVLMSSPNVGEFDAVTFWHVLEHLERPADVLRAAVDRLRPGGLLVLNSPNIDSAVYRLVGRHWSWIYTPGHLQYFHARGFVRHLERSLPLQTVRFETWTDAPNLYFLLEEATLLGVAGVFGRLPPPFRTRGRSFVEGFVYGHKHQLGMQMFLKRIYFRTPFLDRYLRRSHLGHEFLLALRKI
jgi:2-polyprenyl-3-methyl-5-hydroxy-6-metoxy-1,4-benzoquinol methylase